MGRKEFSFQTIGGGCPVCGGRHGGCSQGTEAGSLDYMINCYDQEVLNETERFDGVRVDGELLVRVGEGNGGACSIWVPEDQLYKKDETHINEITLDFIESRPSASGTRRKKNRRPLHEAGDIPVLGAITVEAVSIWFSRIINFMGLDDKARDYLKARGLDDADIKAGKFCTYNIFKLKEFEKANKKYIPRNFPGWSYASKKFILNSQPGIAIPIIAPDGKIIGIQIRHYDGNVRYTWWSNNTSGNTAKVLVSDNITELPIAQARPVEKRSRPVTRVVDNYILLTEGFLKPVIAAAKHSCRAIGASSFNLTSSPVLFKKYLEIAKAESPEPDKALFIICPDANSTRNEHVLSKIKKLCEFLTKNGYEYKILWYEQILKPETENQKKLFGDIDEIDRCINRMSSKFIDLDKFLDIAAKHLYIKSLEKQFAQERDAARYGNKNKWKVKTVNSRFLSNVFDWDDYKSGVIGLKSPMGSGKTELLDALVKKNKSVAEKDRIKTVILGSRNSLLMQTSKRVGAKHKNELIKQQGRNAFRESPQIALCIDSLMRLNITDLIGGCLVLDEAESILNHLLLGSTCAKYRSKIFYHLQAICRAIAMSGGRIVLMDANLSARTLKFFDDLTSSPGLDFPKYLVCNEYQNDNTSWDVELYSGSVKPTNGRLSLLKNDRSALYARVLDSIRVGGKLFICSDSKDEAIAVGQFLNQFLPENQFGLAITSETLDENAQEFLKNPSEWLRDNPNCRYVSASPTVESGLSVDGDFFSTVYGIFYGATTDSGTQLQMLGRVRSPVPRIVFSNEIASGSKSLIKDDPSRYTFDRDIFKSEVLKNLSISGEINSYKHYVSGLSDTEQKNIALNRLSPNLYFSEYLNAIASFSVAQNWDKSNLRRSLKSRLEEAGHRVVLTDQEPVRKEYSLEVKFAKEVVRRTRSSEIAGARAIPISYARSLSETDQSSSPEVLRQIQRAFLQDDLPDIEITEDLVYKFAIADNGRKLSDIKKLARIKDINSYLKIEAASYYREATDSELPMMRVTDLPVSGMVYSSLIDLRITELLDPDKTWTTRDLVGLFSYAKKNKKTASRIGLYPTGVLDQEDALEWANKLLSFVGMTLVDDVGGFVLDTETNFADPEWCEVLSAVQQRLLARGNEAIAYVQHDCFSKNLVNRVNHLPDGTPVGVYLSR